MANIYEPLLWLDASEKTHKLLPGLAVSYEKSDDGLIWSFQLRKNVYFHDGHYFNAEVVKFVVDRNKTFYRGASYIWSNVKEVRVDGEHEVSFVLDK